MSVSKVGGDKCPDRLFFTPSGYGNIHYRGWFRAILG